MTAALYEQDVYRWSQQQAQALRKAASAGSNLPVDWENVAEEIESLGNEQWHALSSKIGIVIEHLLKLEASPAEDPKRKWKATIRRARDAIADRLETSPSLRRKVPDLIGKNLPRAQQRVRGNLEDYGEQPNIDLERRSYGEEQVLGDWFPDNT